MYYEEFGDKQNPTLVFLHGSNFVQSFVNQYYFSGRFHLIVPHITGFGLEAETIFTTEKAVNDIAELIEKLDKRVTVIGFPLGAQLILPLITKHTELFLGAIMVSPWILKEEKMMNKILLQNNKDFAFVKSKSANQLIGMMLHLNKKQTQKMYEYSLAVQKESVLNSINNGIDIRNYPRFANISLPMLAICGNKEIKDVKDSVKELNKINSNCKYEIWETAAHNIPTNFSKKFNATINKFICENEIKLEESL